MYSYNIYLIRMKRISDCLKNIYIKIKNKIRSRSYFVLQGSDEVPDICGFLDGKKESCDKDPDTNPFDDVRHYAYEGEGNSEGSLSSLASCMYINNTSYYDHR